MTAAAVHRGGIVTIAATCTALLAGCQDKKLPPPASITLELRAGEGTILTTPAPAITGAQLATPGLLIPRNDDDSDGDGNPDYTNATIDGADDARQLAVLTVKKLTTPAQAGDVLHVKKKSGTGHVRVFRKEATWSASNSILDTSAAAQTTTAEGNSNMTKAHAADLSFYVEGQSGGNVDLCVAWGGSATVEACAHFEVRNGFGPVIFGDQDRNGTVDAVDRTQRTAKPTLVFVNADRDCPALPPGQPDAVSTSIACVADEPDIAPIAIDVSRLGNIPAGWKPVLRVLDTKAGFIRIFPATTAGSAQLAQSSVTVGAVTYQEMDVSAPVAAAIAGGATTLTIGAEGLAFAQAMDLFLCVVHDVSRIDAACDQMKLETGRALLQSNLEKVATIAVADITDACTSSDCPRTNAGMRGDLAALPAPATLSTIPLALHGHDRWVQDMVEICGHAAPKGNMQLALVLPRTDRPLVNWAATLRGPDLGILDVSTAAGTLDSGQYGGNLEVSPTSGPGTQGQMVLGDTMAAGLVTELKTLSPDQTPVVLMTSWLAVGHVDETMAFYPAGAGWRIAAADTSLGVGVLSSAPAKAALFWHCRTPGRTRAAECYGEGKVTGATVKTGPNAAKLTASGFSFDARPAGREWQWIRVYTGSGRGQVAHVKTIATHSLEVDMVWNLPTPDVVRCAFVEDELDVFCDTAATGLGASSGTVPFWPPATFRKDDWFTVPAAGDRFVIVEDTLDWDPGLAGSAASGGGALNRGVPALITAGELADPVKNKTFLDKQTKINVILNANAALLAAIPGATVRRIPALYQVVDSGSLTLGESFPPGTVNFQVVQGAGSAKIFAARAFGPSTGSADPWEAKVISQLGVTPVYTDDWDSYHIKIGEVHCGTNLFKATAREWWK